MAGPPPEMLNRRELLRLIAGSTLALSTGGALAGCGGGGGGSAGSGSPPGTNPTQPLAGMVVPAEVGGSGWMVQSAYQQNTPTTPQGAYTTTVSGQFAQLLVVTDSGGALRALGISLPSGGRLNLGATSTATALLFTTIGILTTDPTEGAQRVAQIQALSGFPALVAYLAQNLPTATLPTLTQSAALGALAQACVEQWQTAAGQGRPQGHAASAPAGPSGVSASYLGTQYSAQPILLTNSFDRIVYVVRQNLAADGSEIPPQEPGFYVDGVTGASWGALFRGTIGEPGTKTDVDNLLSPTGISQLQYTVNGPGLPSLSGPVPAGVDVSASDAILRSVLAYVFFPLVDLVGGGNTFHTLATEETGVSKVTDYVIGNTALFGNTRDLAMAFGEGEEDGIYTAIINFVAGLAAVVVSIIALAEVGGAVAAAATVISVILSIFATSFAAYNLIQVGRSWFTYPLNSSFTLPVSAEGVVIQ